MAFVSTIIFLFTVFSYFIGQLYRINLFGISFPLIDISLILLSLINIINHIRSKKLKIKNKYFLYFLTFSWITLIFHYFEYQIHSPTPFFYLIRLTCLLSLFIFPLKINPVFKKLFYISIIANIVFGFIQYLFWPNFTYFDSLNWDPHLYRLVSTFFDPTFTALIYLLFLIKTFLCKKTQFKIPLLILSYVAMVLTYSRSTYISFFLVFAFLAKHLKKPKIFIISSIILISTITLLPRQEGEGTKLERTSSIKAKIENYQEAWTTFLQSPIIGIGYNNIPFIRQNKNPQSHANSGFDGSLMTILVSTGLIGIIFFLLGIKKFYQQTTLTKKSMIIIILCHSLFANSFLYPWTLISLLFF